MKRRDMLLSMGSLAVAGAASDALAADKTGKAASGKTAPIAVPAVGDQSLRKAWTDYYATLDEMWKLTEATPRFQQNPQHREQ